MTPRRALLALATLVAAPAAASAQQAPATIDTAGIHRTLRAFYFNLAHEDWEAIAADVLSAKVVAHRPVPEALVAAAASPGRGPAEACASDARAGVDAAVMRLDGDWVGVSVPRCNTVTPGADEFRLIHFQERWRFVYIGLFEELAKVTAER
ncbi:MAG: hypothetical protein H0T68_12085 [Gemmatimonadales bacterium]|nr:hypothetical protein [Gemmatimonadales bacterium]